MLTGAAINGASASDLAAAARLRRRRRDLAGAGAAPRRTRVRRDETLARRGRMDSARRLASRCSSASSRSLRSGYGLVSRESRWPARASGAGGLIDRVQPRDTKSCPPAGGNELAGRGTLPSLDGAMAWLNSRRSRGVACAAKSCWSTSGPTRASTACARCPMCVAWADKYKDHGLVVIGVHSPEFAFERDPDNVRRAVQRSARRLSGRGGQPPHDLAARSTTCIWPAHYFIDAQGRIRHHHFGEGEYADVRAGDSAAAGRGGQSRCTGWRGEPRGDGRAGRRRRCRDALARDLLGLSSRGRNFAERGGGAAMRRRCMRCPHRLRRTSGVSRAFGPIVRSAPRSSARAGQASSSAFMRAICISCSGPGRQAPRAVSRDDRRRRAGRAHGMDIDAEGVGTVTSERLYQLVRQSGSITDHTFVDRVSRPRRAGLLVHVRLSGARITRAICAARPAIARGLDAAPSASSRRADLRTSRSPA